MGTTTARGLEYVCAHCASCPPFPLSQKNGTLIFLLLVLWSAGERTDPRSGRKFYVNHATTYASSCDFVFGVRVVCILRWVR